MDMLPFIFVAVILLGLVGGFALYSGAVENIRFPGRESPETENSTQSKVSMLLSDMQEDGQISKLRVGRENIISKAGEEPEAAGSPFDDE